MVAKEVFDRMELNSTCMIRSKTSKGQRATGEIARSLAVNAKILIMMNLRPRCPAKKQTTL